MSDGELHAALGLHRGRRTLLVALVLALSAVGVFSGVRREPELKPVAPPSPVVELGSTVRPPDPPARRVRRRPRPPVLVATKPARAPPIVAVAPEPEPAVVNEPAPAPLEAPEPAAVEEVESPPPAPPAEELPTDGNAESTPVEELERDGNGERIARAIASERRAAVRTCFEHELKEQPTLTGTVIVELDLAPPTRVDALRISDDLNRPTFTRCVTTAMQSVRFAALDEEISVRVPYVLSPERK